VQHVACGARDRSQVRDLVHRKRTEGGHKGRRAARVSTDDAGISPVRSEVTSCGFILGVVGRRCDILTCPEQLGDLPSLDLPAGGDGARRVF
jgi:hypothetical protein